MIEQPKQLLETNDYTYDLLESYDKGSYVITLYKQDIIAYEVQILRRYPKGRVFHGMDMSGKLRYPCNEDWGKYGWSYSNLNDAKDKIMNLLKIL